MKDFILNQNQKKIIKRTDFLREEKFYLAGGTSLALQLGHRTSRDFDFYSEEGFNSKQLYLKFKKLFPKNISKPVFLEDTLQFRIGSIDLSFFKYPYPLIKPLKKWQSILIASPEDIAAMKIEAIIGRGTRRDFIDIYYLIKKFGLKNVLRFTRKKYRDTFNQYLSLRALIYFVDAEREAQGRVRISLYNSRITWQAIKKYLIKEVKEYQKCLIEK